MCAGLVKVASMMGVFDQENAGGHASASKKSKLVMTPLRTSLWQRERKGQLFFQVMKSDIATIG